jgi:hypothetical protein
MPSTTSLMLRSAVGRVWKHAKPLMQPCSCSVANFFTGSHRRTDSNCADGGVLL